MQVKISMLIFLAGNLSERKKKEERKKENILGKEERKRKKERTSIHLAEITFQYLEV